MLKFQDKYFRVFKRIHVRMTVMGDTLSLQDDAAASCEFMLPNDLSIETVDGLCAEFKTLLLSDNPTVLLNAAQVENITTPGVQLLVSLQKSLIAQERRLTIMNPSDTFTSSCKALDLYTLLTKSS